jgi:fatty-acyl-CoA synthase
MEGTVLCAANHAPLTPISFLERTALVYPDRPAVVAAASAAPPPRTWRETRDRCLRLAAALAGLGVARHHVVKSRAPPPPLFSSCYHKFTNGAVDSAAIFLLRAVKSFNLPPVY